MKRFAVLVVVSLALWCAIVATVYAAVGWLARAVARHSIAESVYTQCLVRQDLGLGYEAARDRCAHHWTRPNMAEALQGR